MKYVEPSIKAMLLAAALWLGGCTTTPPGPELVTNADVRPELASTLEYVPVQARDDDGVTIPYIARENPYTSQRGKVRKESVLSFIAARRAYKDGDYPQASSLLTELIKQDDSLSGPWVMLGDIAMHAGNYQQAIDHYLTALEINEHNVNAYLRLAKSQRLLGNFLHAQNTYAKALSLWPDFPEAHLNLAVLYDIYLNHPLRAQKHMEAYQFLTASKSAQVAEWLAEIQQRTGIAPAFSNEQTALTLNDKAL